MLDVPLDDPGLAWRDLHAELGRMMQPHSIRAVYELVSDLILIARSQPAAIDNGEVEAPRRNRRVPKRYRIAGRVRRTAARKHLEVAAFIGVVSGAAPLHAQGINLDTPDDILLEEDPQGISAGGITFYPALRVDTSYDSNIYNREFNEVEDAIFSFAPTLRIQPELERHAVWFDVAANLTRHMDIADENADRFTLASGWRIDLPARTALRGRVHFAELVEGRGSYGDSFATDSPISYQDTGASLGITRRGSVLGLSVDGNIQKLIYDEASINGVPIDLSYRDVRQLSVSTRAEYRLGSRFSTFARASANDIRYDENPVISRDSSGFSLLAGLAYQPTDQTNLEIAVGYLQQDFDDPTEKDLSGVDFYLSGEWVPSDRTLVRVSGARQIDRSPLENVSAVVRSHVELEVSYAISEQVLVRGIGSFARLDYRGIDRQEERFILGADVEHRLAPRITAYAGASYRDQSSDSVIGREYSGAEVHIGLKVSI